MLGLYRVFSRFPEEGGDRSLRTFPLGKGPEFASATSPFAVCLRQTAVVSTLCFSKASGRFITGRDGCFVLLGRGFGGFTFAWRERDRIKPIERLVRLSFTHCCASTCLLSTWWSTTALGETWF